MAVASRDCDTCAFPLLSLPLCYPDNTNNRTPYPVTCSLCRDTRPLMRLPYVWLNMPPLEALQQGYRPPTPIQDFRNWLGQHERAGVRFQPDGTYQQCSFIANTDVVRLLSLAKETVMFAGLGALSMRLHNSQKLHAMTLLSDTVHESSRSSRTSADSTS